MNTTEIMSKAQAGLAALTDAALREKLQEARARVAPAKKRNDLTPAIEAYVFENALYERAHC